MDLDDSLLDDLDPSLFQKPVQYEEIAATAKQKPTLHPTNEENLLTYIYPTNLQVRDYQYNIVNRALFHNVLVALPTGLGKTFIASTVMLNFLRWFPELKIIFMAPTRPLVAQQIKACCGITGIPSLKVAILLDKTRKNRAEIWNSKQVFFTTPQVVENDLTFGIVDPKLVVLVVIDEAHRAKGNYAYNNVVKYLNRFTNSYRILALTATPASDVDGVQEIVDNLQISKVEVRTEKSIDIFRYLKRKDVERFNVEQTPEIVEIINYLCEAIRPVLQTANQRQIYEVTDPAKINAFTAREALQKLVMNKSIPEGLKWANYFILQLLVMVGQCLRRINIHGIRAFYSYFHDKYLEFTTKYTNKKLTNHLAAKFYFHSSIKQMIARCEKLIADPGFLGHGKLEITIDELENFFKFLKNSDSRVIIFTEFRESALDIVRALDNQKLLMKAHIFIGQAKEKEKFDEDKFMKKGKKKKGKDKEEKEPPKSKGPLSSSEQAQMNGMNQKMQKDLIKQFKRGEYNVLVATSIGEEGLDIGEVDLIICYDSTSSPIKNIQRMGRTGRNRDGKVLLLFSSNEELKFDKAMSGYEYIQNHIMSGNLITLHDQVRVIPKEFTPKVTEQFIEIPDENMDIKAEEDEDEIIKIATKYMNSKGKKSAKAKKPAQSQKLTKKFFMPEDVQTGFKLVSMMVKRSDDNEPMGEKRRKKDVLDSLLDSDEDENHRGANLNENSEKLSAASNLHSNSASSTSPTRSPTKTLGLRRSNADNILRTSPLKKSTGLGTPGPVPQLNFGSSLGVKRRPANILDELKSQPKVEQPVSTDEFDDDDDEILAIARNSSSMEFPKSQNSGFPVHFLKASEVRELFPFEFGENDGLLTQEQKIELYMSYYTPAESNSLLECYKVIPMKKLEDNLKLSTRSKRFIEWAEFVRKNDEERARKIIEDHQNEPEFIDPLADFIDF